MVPPSTGPDAGQEGGSAGGLPEEDSVLQGPGRRPVGTHIRHSLEKWVFLLTFNSAGETKAWPTPCSFQAFDFVPWVGPAGLLCPALGLSAEVAALGSWKPTVEPEPGPALPGPSPVWGAQVAATGRDEQRVRAVLQSTCSPLSPGLRGRLWPGSVSEGRPCLVPLSPTPTWHPGSSSPFAQAALALRS